MNETHFEQVNETVSVYQGVWVWLVIMIQLASAGTICNYTIVFLCR